MSAPALDIITLGCRLNAAESESMRAAARGLNDAVIINTCAVTGEAVRQARQEIRKARRARPDAQIIVTGCAAQIDPHAFAAMPEVDRVIGNSEKLKPETFADAHERVRVGDIMAVRETAAHLEAGYGVRTRAYVQVQNGCDHRCTFCVIPYGRGNARSAPAGDVVAQVRALVEDGCPEIVLTGVDLTSWGGDLPGAPKLGNLVARILKHAPDLKRLRLSSLDAIEMDDALFDLVTGEDRIAPHLHLSLQHGADLILKRMKRRHLRADAIALAERLKAARPEIALGADLIAGFPTETEAHVEDTLALVDACQLSYLHVFPFSPRPGTPAARMPHLPKPLVKERARRLREKGAQALAAHLDRWIGREADALIERDGFARLPDFTGVSPLPLGGGAGGGGRASGTATVAAVRNAQLDPERAPSPQGAREVRLRFISHDGATLAGVPA